MICRFQSTHPIAQATDHSLTEFILGSAVDQAERVLADGVGTRHFTRELYDAFGKALKQRTSRGSR